MLKFSLQSCPLRVLVDLKDQEIIQMRDQMLHRIIQNNPPCQAVIFIPTRVLVSHIYYMYISLLTNVHFLLISFIVYKLNASEPRVSKRQKNTHLFLLLKWHRRLHLLDVGCTQKTVIKKKIFEYWWAFEDSIADCAFRNQMRHPQSLVSLWVWDFHLQMKNNCCYNRKLISLVEVEEWSRY